MDKMFDISNYSKLVVLQCVAPVAVCSCDTLYTVQGGLEVSRELARHPRGAGTNVSDNILYVFQYTFKACFGIF